MCSTQPTQWGQFVTPLVLSPVLPQTTRRLLCELTAPLAWRDRTGLAIVVPAGTRFDGATIPKPFWSFVGGPFDGAYVRAACIHDYQVRYRQESSDVVHGRFYRMMRADGCSWAAARFFSHMVLTFGPQWPASGTSDGDE